MLSPYDSSIDMLLISTISKLSKRQENNRLCIADELCKNQINYKTVNNKNITNAIYTYIREHQIDLLIMVNTRHSFLEDILFDSKVDALSLNIDIPFLTLQNMRRHDN